MNSKCVRVDKKIYYHLTRLSIFDVHFIMIRNRIYTCGVMSSTCSYCSVNLPSDGALYVARDRDQFDPAGYEGPVQVDSGSSTTKPAGHINLDFYILKIKMVRYDNYCAGFI